MVSRGLGGVQQAILDALDFPSHFGASTEQLIHTCQGYGVLKGDTPAARASISRALRGLIKHGYVRSFTVPSVAWDNQNSTEGRRLALWNDILRRQAGLPKVRKLFALTRKGRKHIESPAYAPQMWRVCVRRGESEFVAFVGPIGGEYGARYSIKNNVRVMRHRGPMRPRHYVLKLAARRAAHDPSDDPLG